MARAGGYVGPVGRDYIGINSAKMNAASALPSYTGLKNAILAIKSADAEARANGRPVGTAGPGELVDRAKSAGRLRGADAYKRGGE